MTGPATIAWMDDAREAGKRARETIAKLTAERDEARAEIESVLSAAMEIDAKLIAAIDEISTLRALLKAAGVGFAPGLRQSPP